MINDVLAVDSSLVLRRLGVALLENAYYFYSKSSESLEMERMTFLVLV
jgi:hypothetical protein